MSITYLDAIREAQARALFQDGAPLENTALRLNKNMAGAEAVELIMWLTMRGALSPKARRVHRHYYAPMTTGMGLITFQE